MNERERLVAILNQAHQEYYAKLDFSKTYMEALVDSLIANGVTVQRWIPVTERLPENEGAHLLVCYSDGWICDQYTPFDQGVTHWMPLPPAPEEE